MESESGTADTKVSDSGYSNSYNSNSQRSGSSKSRHSGSNSSRSSGYCITTNPDGSLHETGAQLPKRNKDKEHKKKKLKSTVTSSNFNDIFENIPTTLHQKERTINELENPLPGSEIIIPGVEITKPIDDKLEQAISDLGATATHGIPNTETDEILTEGRNPLWSDENDIAQKDDQNTSEDIRETEVSQGVAEDAEFQSKDGFCCVISTFDGVVLYTTPSLTSVLGFPKDMWLGRSFIDFLHPKDRETFSSQVTMAIALPLVNSQDVKNSLYVCLRKYRGLKSSGYGVVEKNVSYQAFQLTFTFKRVSDVPENKMSDNSCNMFLVVVAVPVYSAYKVPDENKKSSKFGMRHTADCIFSHVDQDVVTNFGFLPQDMLGKSVFEFYHPDDMPLLKEIYGSIMRMRQIAGSVFRSKPYRFAVQNGGFAMIETEWSSFINPWSRRLEFVIGLHRVLQGPQNPNIFDNPKEDRLKHFPDEVNKTGKVIQGEILKLLNEEIARPNEIAKHEVSKRCKDLANFMETLMTEVKKCNLQLEVPHDSDPTISERDSVMLGEISPHHDYDDSKSSSETPPSYNQLNYNENIERFFLSKPKTTVSDSSEDRICSSINITETDLDAKMSSSGNESSQNQKCLSPVHPSGTSASRSTGILSSISNHHIESRTMSATSTDSYRPPLLTEAILHKHNEDMEKVMIKKHREYRSSNKENRKNMCKGKMENATHLLEQFPTELDDNVGQVHGVKRAGSHSWEGDNHKVTKHNHQIDSSNNTGKPEHTINNTADKLRNLPQSNSLNTLLIEENQQRPPGMNDDNLWPPFSVTVTPVNNTPTTNMTTIPGVTGFSGGLFPVHYFPGQRSLPEHFDTNNISRYQVHYMPGIIYNYSTIFSEPPIMCFPVPIVQHPVPSLVQSMTQDTNGINGIISNNLTSFSINQVDSKISPPGAVSTPQFQRPASQATSVKAEPGSAMGSIASASVANNALSECSRKDLCLPSVCSPSSPLVSPPDGEATMENFSIKTKITDAMKPNSNRDTMDEGSSYYSSSYSSFFKTDTGSGSNDDSNTMDIKNSNSDDNSWRKNKHYPIRKRDPPWMKALSGSPDLVNTYQIAVKNIEEILKTDLRALEKLNQPETVNSQLSQLYLEMELEGLSFKLPPEESMLTSGSSSDEPSFDKISGTRKKKKSHSSLVMIYEENAPLPSPDK